MAKTDTPAAPAPATLSYDAVPVPDSPRGTVNPHADKVRELNTLRLSGQKAAAAFTVPYAGDESQHAKDVARQVRYLQEAGQALNITVRKTAVRQDDKSTRVTFWPTEKIVRGKSETSGAAPVAPVAG